MLKEVLVNLLVVGTGIPDLRLASPHIHDEYPSVDNSTITQLSFEDMPEVLAHFIPLGEADELWEVKKTALDELLIATGEQPFSFLTIAKPLMKPEQRESSFYRMRVTT